MNYLLAFLLAFATFALSYRIFLKEEKRILKGITHSTQSRTHSLLKPILESMKYFKEPEDLDTQATRFFDRRNLRVIISGDSAYWIQDGKFFVADIDGMQIIKESTRLVDTMSVDGVELDKLTFIVDKLNDGAGNDNRNPGHKEF